MPEAPSFALEILPFQKKLLLFFLSVLLVSLGQPAWISSFGLLASCVGFALFWRAIIDLPSHFGRFIIATAWFALVQLVQLSWLISHPFWYIYSLYLFLSIAMGIQFALVSLLVTPKRVKSVFQLMAIAGCWVLMEWSRLFVLSGFSFNPVGLALTDNLYSLQSASLFGIYGLSFWVIFVNLLALRAWLYRFSFRPAIFWGIALLAPYLYGWTHYTYHERNSVTLSRNPPSTFRALLVQTAFPIEENLQFATVNDAIAYTQGEWIKILETVEPKRGPVYDMIVLPEYVVPYGTYLPIYPYEEVKEIFAEVFGDSSLQFLPALAEPLAYHDKRQWLVTNAFWSQAIANIFQADLVVGLQDDQWVSNSDKESYSSAFYFWPNGNQGLRYEKRILVPMGEYIPFAFCRELAKCYGICGSFTCGKVAKVFPGGKLPFGLSICYEETYGDLMRENRQKGAEMLINLTSDVWYPGSKLPKQHFDHARLRTVECGIPLLRSCNTGITGALDSLGRVVAILGDGTACSEWIRDALAVEVSTYHYPTLYSRFGDSLIIGFSLFSLLFFFLKRPYS
ncbi:Apolipoprotein N-acyltransferase [Chlamydiales bacterium STE3]|nr:Apolipoprotein N-acyltransferase [Chlamydiales bacterium STE3]